MDLMKEFKKINKIQHLFLLANRIYKTDNQPKSFILKMVLWEDNDMRTGWLQRHNSGVRDKNKERRNRRKEGFSILPWGGGARSWLWQKGVVGGGNKCVSEYVKERVAYFFFVPAGYSEYIMMSFGDPGKKRNHCSIYYNYNFPKAPLSLCLFAISYYFLILASKDRTWVDLRPLWLIFRKSSSSLHFNNFKKLTFRKNHYICWEYFRG